MPTKIKDFTVCIRVKNISFNVIPKVLWQIDARGNLSIQDLDESSPEEEDEGDVVEEVEDVEISEELQAGEATPLSMPSAVDGEQTDQTDSSPEETGSKPVVEVFDLQESSPDDISPDMESQALFVKLKEVRILLWLGK